MKERHALSTAGGWHLWPQRPSPLERSWAERGLSFVVLAIILVGPLQSAAQPVKTQQAECVFTLQGGKKPNCSEPLAVAAPVTKEVPGAGTPALNTGPDVAPPPQPVPKPKWTLQLQDLTLYAAFSRWAKEAGWRVLWDADKHLLIDSPDVVTGDFEQAITAVLSSPGIASGAYPLEVCFYPNTPPLVRITKRGDQAKDCK
jgi:hypothetical protein